jgi:hypothetical protein
MLPCFFQDKDYVMPRSYLRSLPIFVQERERGCFNLTRDGASRGTSREPRQSQAEYGGSAGGSPLS